MSHREHARRAERERRAMHRAGLIADERMRAHRDAERVLPQRNEHGCHKIAYRNENAATRALVTLQRSERDKHPVRAYQCPTCIMWHLTSRERRY